MWRELQLFSTWPVWLCGLVLVFFVVQDGEMVEFAVLIVQLSGADAALRLDLAYCQQGTFGQGGANQLVDHLPGHRYRKLSHGL